MSAAMFAVVHLRRAVLATSPGSTYSEKWGVSLTSALNSVTSMVPDPSQSAMAARRFAVVIVTGTFMRASAAVEEG